MATIKSYSDLQQSKKLAKILPLESADMCYLSDESLFPKINYNGMVFFNSEEEKPSTIIPCWSLASLLEQLPYEVCDDDGYSTYLQINKDDDMYQLIYEDPSEILENIETDRYEHFVDACVDMIEKLHKLNLLRL